MANKIDEFVLDDVLDSKLDTSNVMQVFYTILKEVELDVTSIDDFDEDLLEDRLLDKIASAETIEGADFGISAYIYIFQHLDEFKDKLATYQPGTWTYLLKSPMDEFIPQDNDIEKESVLVSDILTQAHNNVILMTSRFGPSIFKFDYRNLIYYWPIEADEKKNSLIFDKENKDRVMIYDENSINLLTIKRNGDDHFEIIHNETPFDYYQDDNHIYVFYKAYNDAERSLDELDLDDAVVKLNFMKKDNYTLVKFDMGIHERNYRLFNLLALAIVVLRGAYKDQDRLEKEIKETLARLIEENYYC